MFERFTDRSRRVLVLAQEEARLLGHDYIGTEHLLLGLIHEGDGVAARALASLGVDLGALRERVGGTIGPAVSATTGSPPFSPPAKMALESALLESKLLGHDSVGTEHLLLGLMRQEQGAAAEALVGFVGDLGRVRRRVLDILADNPLDDAPPASVAGVPAPADRMTARYVPPPGPRCPSCRARLDGGVAYRVLEVPSGDEDTDADPRQVILVYCLACGVVVAHVPEDPR